MDSVGVKQRSYNMSQIRSSGNKTTEVAFAKILRSNKISGWRRHAKNKFGSPDFIFNKYRIVVFIDGCFWHGCKIHYKIPSTNVKYWKQKITGNINRDRKVDKYYEDNKWKLFRIWEHEIKKNPSRSLLRVLRIINKVSKN